MDIRAKTRRVAGVIPYLALWLALGLCSAVQANTVTYVYTDPQGTPLAEANASGTITATFDYAPYGSQAMGAAHDGPGYTGHVNDANTGLVYMQARFYDPAVGRFLSVDPMGVSPGDMFHFNRYNYANNNPYIFVDPDGRRDVYIGGAADKNNTRIVQSYADDQQNLNRGRDIQYFSYKEKSEIAAAISAPRKDGEPLNVIGHRLGAREAIKQANSTEVKITNLVTIDPVGRAGNGAKPANVETWTDVEAAPSNRKWADTVASAGRLFLGLTATSGAESQTLPTSHGNFPSMMSKGGAQEKVDASYRERTDRQ